MKNKETKVKENKRNIYFLGGIICILAATVVVLYNKGYDFNSASANPDYICVKQVSNQPCYLDAADLAICNATPWSNQKKVCIGKTTTEVTYISTRVGCEAGYTNKGETDESTWLSGDSGRRLGMADYPSDTNSCVITYNDNVQPIGIIEIQ